MNKKVMIFTGACLLFLVVVLGSTRDKTEYVFTSEDTLMSSMVKAYGAPDNYGHPKTNVRVYSWSNPGQYVEIHKRSKDQAVDGYYGWYKFKEVR